MAEVLAFGTGIQKTVGMRGSSDPQMSMLMTVGTEDLIPPDHRILEIGVVVDTVVERDPAFDEMYAAGGRRSDGGRPTPCGRLAVRRR